MVNRREAEEHLHWLYEQKAKLKETLAEFERSIAKLSAELANNSEEDDPPWGRK
jgi:hypothetical protein